MNFKLDDFNFACFFLFVSLLNNDDTISFVSITILILRFKFHKFFIYLSIILNLDETLMTIFKKNVKHFANE